MAARPIIALLTDFGLRDHYVGVMKGVALGICPDATLVDISHEVPPHDVLAGAIELDAAYRYFPRGTVFLVVVDPGVGSSRRGLAIDTGDHRFVGPDNGVLAPVLDRHPASMRVELTNPDYALPAISRTFEGRDRFSPAAAWLARGVALAALGLPIDAVCRVRVPRPLVTSTEIVGEVLRVDRFGNLVTNIDRPVLEMLPGAVVVGVAERRIAGVVMTYAEVDAGRLCALIGSTDRLEISVNGASAAETLGVGRGALVRVQWTA